LQLSIHGKRHPARYVALDLPQNCRGSALRAGLVAANVLPIIEPLKAEGLSLRKIAAALNARGIATVRGGAWTSVQVANVLRRLAV
jgi:hypothetical protein